MSLTRRLYLAFFLVLLILILGSVGYLIIEGWSLFDALYMTVITISTVGYREVAPLSFAGKLLTIFIIAAGVGTVIYTLGTLIEFLVEGHFSGLLGRRRMERQVKKLKDHYIICGFGRVGEEVAKELSRADVHFVVVDNNADKIRKCEKQGFLYVAGDAAEDEVLKAAGVERAKGLIAVVDNDADNIFVTLSAKGLNQTVFVVARAEQEESENKLKKAGADRVVSPASIGGRRMAALLLKPLVCDYLDVIAHSESIQFQLEELEIKGDTPIAEMSIKDAAVRDKTGVLIMAVKRPNGEIITNPSSSVTLQTGDKLVVMGTREQLEEWQGLV